MIDAGCGVLAVGSPGSRLASVSHFTARAPVESTRIRYDNCTHATAAPLDEWHLVHEQVVVGDGVRVIQPAALVKGGRSASAAAAVREVKAGSPGPSVTA